MAQSYSSTSTVEVTSDETNCTSSGPALQPRTTHGGNTIAEATGGSFLKTQFDDGCHFYNVHDMMAQSYSSTSTVDVTSGPALQSRTTHGIAKAKGGPFLKTQLDVHAKKPSELKNKVQLLHGRCYEKGNTEQKPEVKVKGSRVRQDISSKTGEKSTMTKSEKTDNREKKTHKKSSNMPDFKEIRRVLHSEYPELVKQMKARKFSEEYLQLRKKDFVQSTRAFSKMCEVEKLVNLGTSVCTVKTANSQGTGFLLFDNFILTNAHVIEESYDSDWKKLTSAARVNFNMGSEKSLDKEFPLSSDVFAVLKGRNEAGRNVDFALLKLQDVEDVMMNEDIAKLPRLLKEYSSNQQVQGICIIGHPRCDVKKINVSCIVPHEETVSAAGDSVQVSFNFLPDNIQSKCKIEGFSIGTYDTYFLRGSSGSPVFDDACKLVAMHTGGFYADEVQEHAIGYCIPLCSIIWNIMGQLASRYSLDAMFTFIEAAAQNPHLEEYLKECAKELGKHQSERNTKMLARICFETHRNGMPSLSQMHQKGLNKGDQYAQQVQQEIDWLNGNVWMKWRTCSVAQ